MLIRNYKTNLAQVLNAFKEGFDSLTVTTCVYGGIIV